MDQVLRGLDFCSVYIDDLLIASSSPDEHKHHLLVLKLLRHYGIIIILKNVFLVFQVWNI